MVRAVGLLQGKIPGICLEIHGDGPERKRLAHLAEELGVSLVLPGAYDYKELPAILSRASVVALGSRRLPDGDSDGVPTVLIEAMAYGRPVVATTVGSIRDLIRDGETGWVVEPDDPRALASAIERVLTDQERTMAIVRRARQLVEAEFTTTAATKKMLQLMGWDDLLGEVV